MAVEVRAHARRRIVGRRRIHPVEDHLRLSVSVDVTRAQRRGRLRVVAARAVPRHVHRCRAHVLRVRAHRDRVATRPAVHRRGRGAGHVVRAAVTEGAVRLPARVAALAGHAHDTA